jgi:hypothetical protein
MDQTTIITVPLPGKMKSIARKEWECEATLAGAVADIAYPALPSSGPSYRCGASERIVCQMADRDCC